jgi:hypothetical protein
VPSSYYLPSDLNILLHFVFAAAYLCAQSAIIREYRDFPEYKKPIPGKFRSSDISAGEMLEGLACISHRVWPKLSSRAQHDDFCHAESRDLLLG